jgi:predicted restriction endonuclease
MREGGSTSWQGSSLRHIKGGLAEDLWGNDAEGKTWEYIYFLKEGKEISARYEPSVLGYSKSHVFYGAQLLTDEQSERLSEYIVGQAGELVDEEDVEPTLEEVAAFSAQVRKVKTPEEAKKEIERLSEILKKEPVRERIKNAKSLVRNPRIARLVKEQANYTCEMCGALPFIKRSGVPFAEAHHIYELAVTRIDHPDRMLCVCPTCHRVIHYGNDDSIKERNALAKK